MVLTEVKLRPGALAVLTRKARPRRRRNICQHRFAERRNLILFNPVPGNTYSTTRTMIAAYQMVMPGETARSHRHTPNALRLVLDARPRAYAVVDGKQIPMLPGDVILTPSWCWHGFQNESDSCVYGIDFLDAPLVHFLEPMFFEPYPAGVEKTGTGRRALTDALPVYRDSEPT